MDERERIATLIDRTVREARLARKRERDELRRELESHFAEIAETPEALAAAVERFGDPTVVSNELARAHRLGRVASHLLRLTIAVAASAILALAIQLLFYVRIDLNAARLALNGGFSRSAIFSMMIILALVAAWELDIESLCARIEREPLRLTIVMLGFFAAMLLFHARENTFLHPGVGLIASAVATIVWSCTIAILARTDRAFARVFAAPRQ